ncbi:ferric reductase like transmembrane component-domain-containing protein [Podospora aff. communis PSN243]|uniref:Ferric reductase like transmembrane component-domain-containing protein n=1 Tax=Podospora aff. communis PSN243 TaxID=3040156 RepID=A0AAV9G3B8_9PEZI|nr:ferric reductase like transmembrane component-domain-containing protein [Podospora aff. communis PSN243]
MRSTPLLPGLLALSSPAAAFIGYGITMYDPSCAFGCSDALGGFMLECSDHDHVSSGHSHGGGGPTSPECRAGDTPWLTTLAYCIDTMCPESVPAWKKEKYWAEQSTGSKTVAPKWTFAEALTQVKEPPTREVGEEEMLNFTAIANHESWESNTLTRQYFEDAETTHSRYAIVLLVVGFATPIVLTLASRLPLLTTLSSKITPYLSPSLIGKYQVQPLPYLLGNAPTIGHTLYILMFLALNIAFAAGGYKSLQPDAPNAWFSSPWQETMGYASARTGVLGYALLPLTILLAGRNNILLWLSDWSHSTYMLLHRWVARLFVLQCILHSILELVLYIDMGSYEAELVKEYWIWGCVATVAACAMLLGSVLVVRRWSYEVFLIGHVLLAVFVVVGCWYHVEFLFERKWGYELWIYAACAVWFFDRAMRVGRVVKNGVRRSAVTEVSEGLVRVDVPGVRWAAEPGKHTYAYFPTLSPWRPWENHPFSVVPTALLKGKRTVESGSSQGESPDLEKSGAATTRSSKPEGGDVGAGVTLYVKKSEGLTSLLNSHQSLLTLLDGPYPSNHPAALLKTDRLVLIAGGIGVTAVLPFLARHSNIKLAWGLREAARGLADDLEPALAGLTEKDIRIGSRINVTELLDEEEETGWGRIGVVVCGPGSLCDEVRAQVASRAMAAKAEWELEVDAFSW